MARPRIIREIQREPLKREPPSHDIIRPHDWLSDDSLAEYQGMVSSGSIFEMYISESANKRISSQASEAASTRLEVMGFLLGEVRIWRETVYTVVWDVGTTTLRSSPSKVRFDHRALPHLFLELDRSGYDYVIVGWYHSHPGHTCFLSKIDLRTQRTIFDQPFHSALVIDPLNSEAKLFKSCEGGYREIPFAVTSGERIGMPTGNHIRTRRLKAG